MRSKPKIISISTQGLIISIQERYGKFFFINNSFLSSDQD